LHGIKQLDGTSARAWPATAPEPPSDIDLEVLIRLVDELILFIDRIIRSWGTGRESAAAVASARIFFEALRTYRASLVGQLARGAGQRVPIRQVIRTIGPILRGLLQSAGQALSPAQLQALGTRFAAWLRGLGPLMGGGGGEAGAASVAVLWGILLAIIVAYLSVWLGRVIGNTRVGDKTVDEHLFGYFDMLYETYVGPCQVPLGQFHPERGRSSRRRSSGFAAESPADVLPGEGNRGPRQAHRAGLRRALRFLETAPRRARASAGRIGGLMSTRLS
jgi:hypothetical protein